MSIVIVLSYGVITQEQNGIIGGRIAKTYYGFFNVGLLRALSGVALGYFICFFINSCKNNYNIKMLTHIKFALSIIQLSIIVFILFSLFRNPLLKNNDIFYILIWIICFTLLICKVDFLSNILNLHLFSYIGKYSYSIYVCHALPLDIYKKYFFQKESIEILSQWPKLIFCSSVLATILLGVFLYHLVENPSYKFLSKFYTKTNRTC